MSIILSMKNISKIFPGVKALDDICLDLEEAEVHAIVGENGAGKSTLTERKSTSTDGLCRLTSAPLSSLQ